MQVTVHGKKFEVDTSDSGITINGSPVLLDIRLVAEGYFHVIYKNKSYRAEVVKQDHAARTFIIKINGKLYPAEVKDKFDLLLEKMGMNNAAAGKVLSVKAPMPGLIIDLKIKNGDTVMAGDPLLVLEAMKMENIIKSGGEGIVKNVKVKKGDSVEKGQILVEF